VLVLAALCAATLKALSQDPFITERIYQLPKSERARLAAQSSGGPEPVTGAGALPGTPAPAVGPTTDGPATSGDGPDTT